MTPEARAHATWCSQIVEDSAGLCQLSFLLNFLLFTMLRRCYALSPRPKDANGGRSLSAVRVAAPCGSDSRGRRFLVATGRLWLPVLIRTGAVSDCAHTQLIIVTEIVRDDFLG